MVPEALCSWNTAFFPNESCRLPTSVYILLRSTMVLQGQMYETHDELVFQQQLSDEIAPCLQQANRIYSRWSREHVLWYL